MAIQVQSDIKKTAPERPKMDAEKKPEMKMKIDRPKRRRGGFLGGLVSVVIVVIIILAILYGVSMYTSWNIYNLPKPSTEWQAVFLTNGQVYFGHVEKDCNQTMVLTDIYYLQVSNPLQQSRDQGVNAQSQGMGELSLVKLGNELHGPMDEMRINKQHVLFVEDLKSDGKVVGAILTHKEGGEAK